MDPPPSSRSSQSAHNRSQDNIDAPSLARSSSSASKASQSLSSIMNVPDSSIFAYIYEYIQKSFNFGVEPSAILQDIDPADFNPYLTKIGPLLAARPNSEHDESQNTFTLEACFSSIPTIFFSETFDLRTFLDEHAMTQQEVISSYLDMTDVSIFNKISYNWKDLMSTAFNLEIMNSDIGYLLSKISDLQKSTFSTQQRLMEEYIKIMRLNRRLVNTQKVLKRLKLLSDVQNTQPVINEMINSGLYSSGSQLLAKTQETFKAELKGIKSVNGLGIIMEKTKTNLTSQLDQEFVVLTHKFIVINTFSHVEKLIKMLKNNASLDSTYKIFPKEDSYERISELIRNKINTDTLQQSLQVISKNIVEEVSKNVRSMISQLGVHKTDENSKWLNISHPHFIIILQSIISTFHSVFQKFITLSTLVLRQCTPDQGSYTELVKLLSSGQFKPVVSELIQIETNLYSTFFNKLKKILLSRDSILSNASSTSCTSELKELHELVCKVPFICKHLTVASPQQLIQISSSIQKKFIISFHERKITEVKSLLDGENWVKVEVPEEIMKFIMDRRGEASKIAGIKLETPEITATGSLLVFYKVIYEYVKLAEDLHIASDCASRLVDSLKFYNEKTHELIVEAKAVPTKFTKVTAKHLGLSVQGLSLILQELPYIENRLSSKIKDFGVLVQAEFNLTRQNYSFHISAIYEKLSNIIKNRVEEHCRVALTEAKWETMISPSQIDSNYYLKQISTDLTSMHSILLTVLNSNQIVEVFTAILQALAENLLTLFGKIKIDNYVPAQRVKNDTQQLLILLREKFSNSLLEPLEELEDRLQKFVADYCESLLRGN